MFEFVNGCPDGSVIGKRSEDFLPDASLAREVRELDEVVLATGTGHGPMAQHHLLPGGRDADFTVNRIALRDASGRIDGILVVGTDVTDLLRTTTELRRVNEALEQRAAERARELAKVNEFVATIVDSAPTPIITYHPDMRIRSWNPAATHLTGFLAAEALGSTLPDLFPEHGEQIAKCMALVLGGEARSNLEIQRKRKDGRLIDLVASAAPLRRDDGIIDGGVTIWVDVTRQRAAERQLQQAKKMEAVGQLTGNVAHDFNNLLAIIIGNLDLLMDVCEADAEARELVNEAIDAAERGAALTGRLLAFARQQTLRPVAVGIDALIAGIRPLLQRAVGDTVSIDVSIANDLWLARADPGQLESAVLNLSVNARDAMPDGGRLIIAARNATLDDSYVSEHADVAADDYVCVSVSDTGCGIPPEIIGQVFEPFFTTKGTGKGSGLGLSIVYGFVKQSGGHIVVHSKAGAGTSISLFLPRLAGAIVPDPTGPAGLPGCGEMILLVEDDPQLRRTSASTVQALGYGVVTAADAAEALALLDSETGIDLLFTDIVLPGGVNGFELARLAREQRPGLKVLFVSGFVDPALTAGRSGQDARILTKPFRRSELGAMLASTLLGEQAASVAKELT
jgi:PAS domain S-box-containing protein